MSTLTKAAIANVLGPVGDNLAAELIATGASAQELRDAHAWVVNDEALVNELKPFPRGRVAELVEILRPLEGCLRQRELNSLRGERCIHQAADLSIEVRDCMDRRRQCR